MGRLERLSVGCVGAGNMGAAFIEGLLASGSVAPERITVADVRREALDGLAADGVRVSTEALDAVAGQDVVILAVKPQVLPSLLSRLAPAVKADQLVLSFVAGVGTATLEAALLQVVPVVRAMPQTLVRLRVGATALCAGRHAGPEHMEVAHALCRAVGTTVEVAESQMDAVTGLSGSGPAYVYTVVEALADGGVRMGLPRQVALVLAAQTVAGAARMVLESGLHPALLREQVTSPGGTTIAGLHMLEEKGLRDALMSAVRAAALRAAELGQS